MIHELTMPPTDYFENEITLQSIQNIVHTNLTHKNQMYFYNANGFHKKEFTDFKSSIFKTGTQEEISVILELPVQSHITQLQKASFTLYSTSEAINKGQLCCRWDVLQCVEMLLVTTAWLGFGWEAGSGETGFEWAEVQGCCSHPTAQARPHNKASSGPKC